MTTIQTEPVLQRAVADAVRLVNTHSGETCVRLRFRDAQRLPEVDFIANSASFDRGAFEFTAGFETYAGAVDDLEAIQAELIHR